MKNVLCLLLALACVLSLAACSGSRGVSQEDYDSLKQAYDELKEQYDALVGERAAVQTQTGKQQEPTAQRDDFDAETVLSQLEVQEYKYSSNPWHYAFLSVKNNSEYDLSISVSVKFYNDGELIGAKDAQEHAFEKGTEILLYFMPDEDFTEMEYEISADKEDGYECVVSELSYENVSAKNKEIISITNNGEYAAEFVECRCLFFSGEKVVGFDSQYFTDDDYELKPGKTITKELDCYEAYDSAKFFFTGRR
jgi:lipoprotein